MSLDLKIAVIVGALAGLLYFAHLILGRLDRIIALMERRLGDPR
jgi:hypothetical protein